MLDFDETVLLYEINRSRNPNFPYMEHFDLHSMSDDDCKAEFRFLRRDIYTSQQRLNIPNEIITANRSKFERYGGSMRTTKTTCIYPSRYSDLIPRFGRSVPEISSIFNETLDLIYNQWQPC